MFKRIHALTMSCILAVLIVSLATGGEVRKLGEYDLSWGPYNTTWTSPGGKVVRYIPRYFDNNAFADNLSLFGKSLTGDGTGYITGFGIPLYGTNYLSVLDALTAWTDVRAYGAVGDNTTDDTAAIQAAIDASTGTVYFPSGIYVISSSLNLKTATEYRGPLGGTFFAGQSHSAVGYGAALRWAGAANGIMVNMEGTYNSVWHGVDFDGGDVSDNVTAIRLHSDNDPPSQRNTISNVSIFNCGYGIIVGGLPGESYSYQTDGWVIEKFYMFVVGTGIYINGGNASQYSVVKNGIVGQYDAGVYCYECAFFGIEDVYFTSLESPSAGEANIILRLPQNQMTITRTGGEPHSGDLWTHILFTTGANTSPVVLTANAIGGMEISNANPGQKIVSLGNFYFDNVILSGNNIEFTSIGDRFGSITFPGVSIVDNGSVNIVTEITPTYYETGYAVPFRQSYNQAIVKNHTYDSADFKAGFATLTVDNTTPSVLAGSLFRTANTTPTTISNFLDGVEGQRITVQFADTNTTIDFSSSYILGNAGIDNTMAVGDWIDCVNMKNPFLTNVWHCIVGKSQ